MPLFVLTLFALTLFVLTLEQQGREFGQVPAPERPDVLENRPRAGRRMLFRGRHESFLKYRAEGEEFFQTRWFADVSIGAATVSVSFVLRRIRRAENYDRYPAALLATAHGFQDLPSRLLREVQIHDYEIRAINWLRIKSINELYGLLAIIEDHQFSIHTVLFQRDTHQTRIGGIIFHEQNKSRLGTLTVTASFPGAGL